MNAESPCIRNGLGYSAEEVEALHVVFEPPGGELRRLRREQDRERLMLRELVLAHAVTVAVMENKP